MGWILIHVFIAAVLVFYAVVWITDERHRPHPRETRDVTRTTNISEGSTIREWENDDQ